MNPTKKTAPGGEPDASFFPRLGVARVPVRTPAFFPERFFNGASLFLVIL